MGMGTIVMVTTVKITIETLQLPKPLQPQGHANADKVSPESRANAFPVDLTNNTTQRKASVNVSNKQ